MAYRVTNLNCDGEVITDLSQHIIKHDEFPEIWYHVALIAEGKKNKEVTK